MNHSDAPTFSFSVHPSVQVFKASPLEFLARHFDQSSKTRPPAPSFLATGAIVFNRPLGAHTASASNPTHQPPRVLLIQRAPHDSMPLKWETPGGGCDDDDATILDACVRELKEEAGLVATAAGPLVAVTTSTAAAAATSGAGEGQPQWGEQMGGHYFLTRGGRLVCKFYFIIDVPEDETAKVAMDPNEHAAFVWATEDEVRSKKMDGEPGLQLDFTTREQWWVILEAFKLWA